MKKTICVIVFALLFAMQMAAAEPSIGIMDNSVKDVRMLGITTMTLNGATHYAGTVVVTIDPVKEGDYRISAETGNYLADAMLLHNGLVGKRYDIYFTFYTIDSEPGFPTLTFYRERSQI